MSEERGDTEPTLVEKWIKDQQEWQKMAMEYFDSMVKNDEFLVNLGNAMRGSLLADKPYPGTEPPPNKADDESAAADDRTDEILHLLHRLEGDVADLKMAIEDLLRTQSEMRAQMDFSARAASETPPEGSDQTAPSAAVPGDSERGEV